MSEELKPSSEWYKEFDYAIADPDGWNRMNFDVSWSEPISRDEFEKRAWMSTIMYDPDQKYGR